MVAACWERLTSRACVSVSRDPGPVPCLPARPGSLTKWRPGSRQASGLGSAVVCMWAPVSLGTEGGTSHSACRSLAPPPVPWSVLGDRQGFRSQVEVHGFVQMWLRTFLSGFALSSEEVCGCLHVGTGGL